MTEVEIHNRLVRLHQRKARRYNNCTMRAKDWVYAMRNYHNDIGDLLEEWQRDMERRGIVK